MQNDQFVSTLEELYRNHASGILIVVTVDNHQIRIGFRGGEIVHLATQRLQGAAAVPVIVGSTCRSLSFTPGSTLQPQPNVPATEMVINAVRNGKPLETDVDFSAVSREETSGITAAALHIIEEELKKYVGPIASVLIDEIKKQPSITTALQKLSTELPPGEAKEAFFARVRSRLKTG